MKIEKNMKIGMSIALASILSLGVTGCGSSDDGAVAGIAGIDITVERGKVFDANVTDSSSPAQVASQKSAQNVYTFAGAPVYPVLVNGGWIDVNDDGAMDASDVKLDIVMRSYSTTVTPVTTFIADANETVRENNLNALVARLNEAGVGTDANITAEDLLKVPSLAPRDVFVAANAIYKDMKENANALPDENAILTQFATIDTLGADATAKDFEVQIVADLVTNGNAVEVTTQEIFEFGQALPGAVVPELAQALLLNNVEGLDPHGLTFNSDYTVTAMYGTTTWSVDGTTLIINGTDGDRDEYTFSSATPTDGSSVSHVGYYGTTVTTANSFEITVTAPVVETSPTPVVTPDLTDQTVFLYKNIATATANTFLAVGEAQLTFTTYTITSTASCTDYGFTATPTTTTSAGISTSVYMDMSTIKVCAEADYAGSSTQSGTSNIAFSY